MKKRTESNTYYVIYYDTLGHRHAIECVGLKVAQNTYRNVTSDNPFCARICKVVVEYGEEI